MAPVDSNSGDHVVPYAAYLKQIMQQGLLQGQLPAVTTNPNLLEAMARDFMPKNGFDYIRGGAGESATMDANRLAFRQWKLVPRVLTPTDPRDLSVTLFGKKYSEQTVPPASMHVGPIVTEHERLSSPYGPRRCPVSVPR